MADPSGEEDAPMQLVVKLLINAAAIWVAARIVDGITLEEEPLTIILVALVFGLVNTFIRPILKLVSLPALILTLGLFTFVINAAMLAITAGLLDGLSIDGFGAALLGAVIVTIVSWGLNALLTDD
jgi:putative membrane protein